MRRVVLTTLSTVAGVVALLSVKSHPPITSSTQGLPTLGLPSADGPMSSADSPATASQPEAGIAPASSPVITPTTDTTSAPPPPAGHPTATSGAPSSSVSSPHATASTPRVSPTPTPTPTHAPSPTKPAPSSSAAPAARTYVGSAAGTPYGTVQVKITVSSGRITNVGFAQLSANDAHSQQVNSYAAPILLRETSSAQSAHIDSVSGASYTSAGYIQSLQNALDQAGLK